MFDPIDEPQPLSPLVAAYTSAERRANVATQLRDRFGRWVEMGRDFSFKFKSGGNVKNATGKFVGAVPNRPGYGLILVENNEDFGSSVVEVNMKSGQQVLAKLSADALRKAGVTKAGHDVNGNPIGDVIDADIEDVSALKKNEITDLDRELAQGKLTPEQKEAIDAQRASAPNYESTNVVAEIDATKEDLGEGYRQLQEALGRTTEAEKEKDGPVSVYDLELEKFEDIVELLDKDPKKLSDSDLLKVVAQERDYAQTAERDKSGFFRTKAREAEAEAIKRGLVKDRYSDPSGTPMRLIPKAGEGLPFERENRPLDSTDPNVANFKTATNLKPGDEVKMPDGTFRKVNEVRSVDSGSMVFFEPVDGGRRRSSKIYGDNDLVELKTPKATTPAPQKDSVELARELNEIAGNRAGLQIVASQMRRFGANPQELKDVEARLAKLDEEFEAKRAEYQASLPDTSEQDAIDKLERLKSDLQWYDNEQGDVARKIDEGVSGLEIIDWLRENSAGWREAEADLETSWAVDLPRRPQREAWAKFEKLRSDLEGYNAPPPPAPPIDGDGDGDGGGNDRDRVYKELAEALGIEESELRKAATGEGSDQALRIADSIEYFGDLIDADNDTSAEEKKALYDRLTNVLKQDVENAKTNTPASGPEVEGEPQSIVERVARDGGGTVEADSAKKVETGIAVALRGGNEELVDGLFFDPELGALAIRDYLEKNEGEFDAGNKLGLWHDKDNREVVLDIAKIFDENTELEEAEASGRENNQQAIFGIGFRGLIETGGTGDRGRARRQREESRLSREQSSTGRQPEGIQRDDLEGATGVSSSDTPGSYREHPEEQVDLSPEAIDRINKAVDRLTQASVLGNATQVEKDAAELKDSVEKKDNKALGLVRKLAHSLSTFRRFTVQKGNEDPKERTKSELLIRGLESTLKGIRQENKNKVDAVSEALTTMSPQEIAPEMEIPASLGRNIIDELSLNTSNIDFSQLTESQAKLVKALITNKNALVGQMGLAFEEGNDEKFNSQYAIAKLYAKKLRDLLEQIEYDGASADVFGGINNRLQNVKIIEDSIEFGDTYENDNVLTKLKAIFIGKSGKAYQFVWDTERSDLNLQIYVLNADGSIGEKAGNQALGNGRDSQEWHEEETDLTKRNLDENGYPAVTPGYLEVGSSFEGDGLGGVLTLLSQYIVESSGRKFSHSNHLKAPGNRNSKSVSAHDPELHHPSQLEKLMDVGKSKITQWYKDMGWAGSIEFNQMSPEQRKNLIPQELGVDPDRFAPYTVFNFYNLPETQTGFENIGPLYHLHSLMKQHAALFYNESQRTALGDISEKFPMPSVYKNFIASDNLYEADDSDFNPLEIIKELGYEGGINKEEAIRRLVVIRDSMREASQKPWTAVEQDVYGISRVKMENTVKTLDNSLTALIEKLESEEFTEEDKLPRPNIDVRQDIAKLKSENAAEALQSIEIENSKGGKVSLFNLNISEGKIKKVNDLFRELVSPKDELPLNERPKQASDLIKNAIRKSLSDGDGKSIANELADEFGDGYQINREDSSLDMDFAYHLLMKIDGLRDANSFFATEFDENNNGSTSYLEQASDFELERQKFADELNKIYESSLADIPPIPREVGGTYDYISGHLIGGSTLILEEDAQRDLTARRFPLIKPKPRALYDNFSGGAEPNVLIRIDEPHVQTVSEERWLSEGATDDPRLVALNFSTTALTDAYFNLISGTRKDNDNKISLFFGNGASIEAGHTLIRDALQIQGVDTDAIVDRVITEATYRMNNVRNIFIGVIPTEAVLESDDDYENFSRSSYIVGDNRVIVKTSERKNANGEIASIFFDDGDNVNKEFGNVIENSDKTYTVRTNGKEVGTVADRNLALALLEKEAESNFGIVSDSKIIKSIDRDNIPTNALIMYASSGDIEELNITVRAQAARLQAESNLYKEFRFGLNGQPYVFNFNPSDEINPLNIYRYERRSNLETLIRLVKNDNGTYVIPMGGFPTNVDGVNRQEVTPTSFKDLDEAIVSIGENLALSLGGDVNPLNGEAVRRPEELPNGSFILEDAKTNPIRESYTNFRGYAQLPRGGQVHIDADILKEFPNPEETLIKELNTVEISGTGYKLSVELQNKKYVVSIRKSISADYENTEFDSYREALEFAKSTIAEKLSFENSDYAKAILPAVIGSEKIEAPAVPEPESRTSPEVAQRLDEVINEIGGEELVIEDNFTESSQDVEDIGGTSGSHPVVILEDKDGKKWILKKAISGNGRPGVDYSRHRDIEVFAQGLYRVLGVNASAPRRANRDGNSIYLVSPLLDINANLNVQEYGGYAFDELAENENSSAIDNVREGFPIDLLMNNFDLFFHPNNMIVVGDQDEFGNSNQEVYRVDSGSALFYLPAGSREAYGAPFSETNSIEEIIEGIESFSRGMPNSSLIRGSYEDVNGRDVSFNLYDRNSPEMKAYVEKVIAPMSDEVIEKLANAVIADDVDRERTINTLKYRRDGMLEYYGVDNPHIKTLTKTAQAIAEGTPAEEAKALGMPEGYLVIRRPEEKSIQIEHSEEQDSIPHPMVTINENEEDGSFDVLGFNASLDLELDESFESEQEALAKAKEFLEGKSNPETVTPPFFADVAPKVENSEKLMAEINNTQLVVKALKDAFENYEVLPNGDLIVAKRDFKGTSRGSKTFRYEVVAHRTKNDDFISYVRQYEIDSQGNRVGEVRVARFTDLSHSAEVTVDRARALLSGNGPQKGINGKNPNNWFNNSGDIESEGVDPANGSPLPTRLISDNNVEYIGNSGIPKTGNASLDSIIDSISESINSIPSESDRQEFVQNVMKIFKDSPILKGAQLEEVIERILANREGIGENRIPYPSKDGQTIVRVGDKVKHTFRGREKIGYVKKRIRVKYRKPSGEYSYQDIVYVSFPGQRGGWTPITTKNLEVLSRSDGSKPLPVGYMDSVAKKPSSANSGSQLKWQDGSDGRAYLGGQGKTSEELEKSASAYIQTEQMIDGEPIYRVVYKNANGIETVSYYSAKLNSMDEMKRILENLVREAN
jgi:hypothetical protein